MAVVIFDPAEFKAAFPEFAAVPDLRLTTTFTAATAILDNTDASIVQDVDKREAMFYYLVAHLLTLFGTTVAGSAGAGPSGVVGRLSSATEGSVSSSFEMNVPPNASAAWWNQTQYGATFWLMTLPYRSMRYVAAGRSGVGRSLDYLNWASLVNLRGANSTPGGV